MQSCFNLRYFNLKLADKDYFVKYQSEECNQIIAKVLKAKDIADDLDGYIEDDNLPCKRKNKRLQSLLESISGVRSTTTKQMEINQADFMQIAKESLEKMHEALILDKAKYNEDSDEYRDFEGLRRKTAQLIRDLDESMKKLKAEEMAEEIVKLKHVVELLTEETQKWNIEDQQKRNACTNRETDSPSEVRWSLNNMEIFQRPMCLISAETTDSQKKDEFNLRCNKKAFEQIEKIHLPIVVVAVVSLQNTKKSHLMNHLGFETIQPPNKGVWAFCKMHQKQANTVFMLLDFESIGDVEKGNPSYDNNLFTLATLLCNCLVYNMEGAFDDNAVTKLTFVTETAKNIKFRGRSLKGDLAPSLIMPDFILCLKDFNLMLAKEKDYFEQCLAEGQSKAENISDPRDCIRKYFPKRECFAFPVLRELETLERQNPMNIDLDHPITNFISTMCRFVAHIYSIPPKELLASKPVNGKMFVVLADHYVTAIKKCEVLDVNDTFKAVAKNENAKIEKEAVEKYVQQLRKLRLPVSEDVLLQTHTIAQQTALEYLRKNVIHDKKSKYESQAQMKMDSVWNEIKYDNIDKVREMCAKKLQDAFKIHIGDEIDNKYFETAGGFQKFQRDFKSLKEEYDRNVKGFKEKEILWTWYGFVTRIDETEIRIAEADTDLSQTEKEDVKRRKQIERDRLLNEQMLAQTNSLFEQRKHMQNHYRILKKNRHQQLENERLSFEKLVHERLKQDKEAQREIEEYNLAQVTRMQIWETESLGIEVALANLDQYTKKQDERLQRFENNCLNQVKEAMRKDFERYDLEQRSKMQRIEHDIQKVTIMLKDLKQYKSREDVMIQVYESIKNESMEQVKHTMRTDIIRYTLEQKKTIQRLEEEIKLFTFNISDTNKKMEQYKKQQETRIQGFENGLRERVRSYFKEIKDEQKDEFEAFQSSPPLLPPRRTSSLTFPLKGKGDESTQF